MIGRITSNERCYPFDRFVGMPRYPWKLPVSLDILLRSSSTLVHQLVVTSFCELVVADLYGVIFTRYLRGVAAASQEDAQSSERGVLRGHLHPRRPVRPTAPELFTWSSVFNSVKELWPAVAGLDQLTMLSTRGQTLLANQLLGCGLDALAAESSNRYVRLAAMRLLDMCEMGMIDLEVTREPHAALRKLQRQDGVAARMTLPEQHGLAYIPAPTGPRAGQPATILVPLHWMDCALNREVVGLAHLARLASLARDDYFGLLRGAQSVYSRVLGLAGEVSRSDVAMARADRIAATLLAEALEFDTRIYGLRVRRDDYCRAIERTTASVGFYDDPPEPRPRQGARTPGKIH